MMLTAFALVSNAQRTHPATVGSNQDTKEARVKPAKGANKKAAKNAPTTAPEGGVIAFEFAMLPYNVSIVDPSARGALLSDVNASTTLNAAGEVFDVYGGNLAVTGRTGVLAGAYGEVKLIPVYETESL